MKKLLIVSCLLLTTKLFAQISEIDKAFETVITDFSNSYPEATVSVGTSPEAWIGNLFPSTRPHFSVGLAATGTFVNVKKYGEAINDIISDINGISQATTPVLQLDDFNTFPLPAVAINARIGGIFLPFDIGIYGSYFRLSNLNFSNVSSSFNTWSIGGDIRYAVLKGDRFLPKLSVGVGYIFTHLGAEASVNDSYTVSATVNDQNYSLPVNTNVNFNLHTIFSQIQVSKKLLVFIPYFGIRLLWTASQNDYTYKYSASTTQPNLNVIKLSGYSSKSYNNDFSWENTQAQLYAGLGLYLGFFELNLGGSWNVSSNLWSIGLGTSFRL